MAFNTCKIKNIDSITHSILGTEVEADSTYTIDDSKRIAIANNDSVLGNITAGNFEVHDSIGAIATTSKQIDWLKDINNTEVDSEGRQTIRQAAAKKGWSYIAHPVEFETSKLASVVNTKWDDTDRGDVTIKFYDASNVEQTTQPDIDANAVKTEVLFKPSYDYELVSGTIHHIASPTSDVRVWVIGGIPELGAAGIKEFVGGVNMIHLSSDEALRTDGRASKYMAKTITGIPYNANQIKTIIRHGAGVKHKIMLILEYFRE